jgi:uncharacterized membrane protein YgdD (TMEM256/DUF423 family)
MHPLWLRWACLAGFVAVAAGAFGAHGLQTMVSADALGWWQTGTRYALFHVVGLVAVAIRLNRPPRVRAAKVAGWAFLVGMLLFTGSLWAMTLTGFRPLGAVTPLGGVAFLVGWVALGLSAERPPPQDAPRPGA